MITPLFTQDWERGGGGEGGGEEGGVSVCSLSYTCIVVIQSYSCNYKAIVKLAYSATYLHSKLKAVMKSLMQCHWDEHMVFKELINAMTLT